MKVEYNKDFEYYYQYIKENDIDKLFGFDDELVRNLSDFIIIDKIYSHKYERSVHYYIFMLIIGLIYNYFYSILKVKDNRCNTSHIKNIFIQAPSKYNRFGKLAMRLPDSMFCYLPILNCSSLNNLLADHKQEGTPYFVLRYTIKNLYKTILKILQNYKTLNKISDLISCNSFNPNMNIVVCFLKYISVYNLCADFYCEIGSRKGLINIITDYDKSINTLVLKKLKRHYTLNYRIITINHGAFYGFNLSYVKPQGDIVFCTNKREVELTKRYSPDTNAQIEEFGIHLVSFNKNIPSVFDSYSKQILVLGTQCIDGWTNLQKLLIRRLKKESIDFIYRARPASAVEDLAELSDVLAYDDCTHNTSLQQDCCRHNRIISFSFDALGVAIKTQSEIAIFVPREVREEFCQIGTPSDQIIISSNINEIMEYTKRPFNGIIEYSDITKEWIKNNVGETDFDKIVKKIFEVLN